jgi:hypothetical protein
MTQAAHHGTELSVHPDAQTLNEVRVRRAGLRRSMEALEAVLLLPLESPSAWAGLLAGHLEDLDAAWDRHIAVTEDAGGLFGQIRTDAPHLDPKLQRLHREHEAIRGSIARVRADVAAALGDDTILLQLRESVTSVLSDLMRHQERGADLVYDAYEVDLGGGG